MDLSIYQLDAFSMELFAGNPAAVVPLQEWIDDSLMQKIAAENNLAETAFIVPINDTDDHSHVRWFTPTVEVLLCGHATLASVAVIHRKFSPASWPITLQSASGQLSVDVEGDAFVLDFPADEAGPGEMPEGLQEVLGVTVEECFATEGF